MPKRLSEIIGRVFNEKFKEKVFLPTTRDNDSHKLLIRLFEEVEIPELELIKGLPRVEPDLKYKWKKRTVGFDLKSTRKESTQQATLTNWDKKYKDYQEWDKVFLLWIKYRYVGERFLDGIIPEEFEIKEVMDCFVKVKGLTLLIQWKVPEKRRAKEDSRESEEFLREREVWYDT